MPKARTGDGSNGDVRVEGTNGYDRPSAHSARRFPLVDACSHHDGSPFCRQTQCAYHLEHRSYGEHRLNPTRDCALAVANEGEHTTEEVAAILGISRERVRQIEERAIRKLQRFAALRISYRER
jgi:DNA-binding CsgD family transcriptional regulator